MYCNNLEIPPPHLSLSRTLAHKHTWMGVYTWMVMYTPIHSGGWGLSKWKIHRSTSVYLTEVERWIFHLLDRPPPADAASRAFRRRLPNEKLLLSPKPSPHRQHGSPIMPNQRVLLWIVIDPEIFNAGCLNPLLSLQDETDRHDSMTRHHVYLF